MLDRLREMLFESDGDAATSSAVIDQRRKEARARLEAVQEELAALEREAGDAALEGGVALEDHEARVRELEREERALEAAIRRLGEQHGEARIREDRARLVEIGEAIPDEVETIRRARRELEEARATLSDALSEAARIAVRLKRKAGDHPSLPRRTVEMARSVEGDLPGDHRTALRNLAPASEASEVPEKRIITDGNRRYFIGTWNREELLREGFDRIRGPDGEEVGDLVMTEGEYENFQRRRTA